MRRKLPWDRGSGYDPRGQVSPADTKRRKFLGHDPRGCNVTAFKSVEVPVDGEERWTIQDQRTGESVCHILCNSTMSTETLFEGLSVLLRVTEDIDVPADELWFNTKLDSAMAADIDALELMPYFDMRHQALLTGTYR